MEISVNSQSISSAQPKAHDNNLRRRNDEQVTCPCIDSVLDDKLINSGALEIDLHRTRSCVSNEPDAMERIYWTPIDPNERPSANIVRPIDGVKYNYIKAIYDPKSSYYSCTRNDMRLDYITSQQAKACIDLLRHTCDNVKPQLCGFDVTFMESIKKSVSDGGMTLDQDMTCKQPTSREENEYGIYTKHSSVKRKVAISYDKDEIIVDSESREVSNQEQGTHCTDLIASTCSGWKLTRNEESQCMDDPNFRLHANIIEEELEAVKDLFTGTGRTVKNCEWVAEDLTRCRAKSKSGRRVFESCRQTCGYCTCSDNEGYRFNGQADKGCEWIKQDSSERCSLEGASEHCKTSCGTKCCEDNPNFRFQKEEHKTCGWARKNRAQRCTKRAVAVKCPETCGLCPSS